MFSFQKNSLAGTGWIIMLVSLIAKWANLDLDEGQITEIATALVIAFGFLTALVGQMMRQDLTWGFRRK